MNRRTFVGTFAAALSTAVTARAQQGGRVWKIGYLSLNTPERARSIVAVVEAGLRDLGYVPGKDVVIESRVANGQPARLAEFARQLVEARVDVILAQVNPDIAAAKQATSTIPIVMMIGVNPVGSGFIETLARPGGNITGMTFDTTPDTTAKNLQLLKEAVPKAHRIALLWDMSFPGIDAYVQAVKTSSRRLGTRIREVPASAAGNVMAAVDSLSGTMDDAVLVFGSPLFVNRRAEIVTAIAKRRLPAIYPFRDFTDAGGLMSYGVDLRALWARAPVFVDKIFRGARPGELPVEQPTKFELVVNLQAARALPLVFPPSLLVRADTVLE